MTARSIAPATFFLISSLLVGILYCIVVPYGAGFDEERHLVRIYYMSQFHFLPNFPKPEIHEDVAELSYQRRLVQSPAFDMFSRETFFRRFSTFNKIRYGQKTQSIYSPVIFLPQALVGRILWWKYDFPILPTIVIQRMIGLLIYSAGAYIAIGVLPYGKWIFTALALLPSTLFQASTINADGFTTAVSFAFIAWVLFVYLQERSGIAPRSIWILTGLSILLGLAKPGAMILLPLLLILLKHPFPSKAWLILLGAGVLISICANIGWWALASRGSVFSQGGEQSLSNQSSMIVSDPVGFFKLFWQSVILSFPYQIQSWIAAYGYSAGTVPPPVYVFTALFLLTALLAEPPIANITIKIRIFLVVLFLFCCAAIYGIAFAANYATGGVLALAKHGRYYIPFAPLFFLGLSGVVTVRENIRRSAVFLMISSFLFVTGYYSFGIYTTYYTYCGYNAYVGGKCILPVYKNLEKENLPEISIQEGMLVSQTFTNLCGELEMVSVFINSVPEGSAGSLRLMLLDDQHQVLASRDFPIDGISTLDYLNFPIKGVPDSSHKNYEIRLESIDLPPQAEIKMGLGRADYYPGQLSVNQVPVRRRDLLIHYECTGP
jgi:uncharacterized membrane protein